MRPNRGGWTALVLAAGLAACNCGSSAAGHPSAPPDAGFGASGPWPTDAVTVWDSTSALDAPVIDVSTDEAQNIWAASHEALYLLRPGETRFRRYDAADGLHLATALAPGITAAAGGAANEAWVGYQGAEVLDPQHDPERTLGKLDRVQLDANGQLTVTHYDVHNNDAVGFDPSGNVIRLPNGLIDPQYTDWSFNENRTVMRFLYDHLYNRGSLYVGFQHGVDRIDAGHLDSTTGFDYSDHVHPLLVDGGGTPRMGEWRGLALDPAPRRTANGASRRGMLWMGGRWTAGALGWTPALFDWARNERNPFWVAFGNPPVFGVPPGGSVYISGIAPLSDGTVYFASGPGNGAGYAPLGIAHWNAQGGFSRTIDPVADLGLPDRDIIDLQRLPDDTVIVALPTGLWRWDPRAGASGRLLGKLDGLASGAVNRVYVDATVRPTGVYVASDGGIALLRLLEVR